MWSLIAPGCLHSRAPQVCTPCVVVVVDVDKSALSAGCVACASFTLFGTPPPPMRPCPCAPRPPSPSPCGAQPGGAQLRVWLPGLVPVLWGTYPHLWSSHHSCNVHTSKHGAPLRPGRQRPGGLAVCDGHCELDYGVPAQRQLHALVQQLLQHQRHWRRALRPQVCRHGAAGAREGIAWVGLAGMYPLCVRAHADHHYVYTNVCTSVWRVCGAPRRTAMDMSMSCLDRRTEPRGT